MTGCGSRDTSLGLSRTCQTSTPFTSVSGFPRPFQRAWLGLGRLEPLIVKLVIKENELVNNTDYGSAGVQQTAWKLNNYTSECSVSHINVFGPISVCREIISYIREYREYGKFVTSSSLYKPCARCHSLAFFLARD